MGLSGFVNSVLLRLTWINLGKSMGILINDGCVVPPFGEAHQVAVDYDHNKAG